ncbi:hypothetical protein HDV00_011133 [Rhizophlyctis rosea]|nr:hypothetical protein HDV00_011133 [Rhizophlyctis rosea]
MQALCRACKLGHIEVVKILIKAGAHVNEQDGRPLCLAAEHGHEGVLQELLANGADLKIIGTRHDGVLACAAKAGQVHIMEILLNHVHGRYTPDELAKALRTAASHGRIEAVRYLLAHGADVTGNDDAALFSAAANGRDEIVRILLEAGAGHLNEALRGAQYWGRDQVIQTLLHAGAELRG